MYKRTKQQKAEAIEMLKQNLSIDFVHHKTKTPMSTLRLWKSNLRKESTANIEHLVEPTKAATIKQPKPSRKKFGSKEETKFMNLLIDRFSGYEPIQTEFTASPLKSTLDMEHTSHIIIRDFAATKDGTPPTKQTIQEAINKLLSFRNTNRMVFHFIGDTFSNGSVYKNKQSEEEIADNFMLVYRAIHTAMSSLGTYRELDCVVHGNTMRDILLGRMLNETLEFNQFNNMQLAVLSGYKTKKEQDDKILSEFEGNPPKLYTDACAPNTSRTEFYYRDVPFHKGFCVIRLYDNKTLCTIFNAFF